MSVDRTSFTHPLDLATQLTRVDEHTLRGESSDAYWNFVGPFGGLVNAALLRAVLEDPNRRGSPVALTVNFCAPVAAGPYDIRVKLQRSGKITQHWSLEYLQTDRVVATSSIVTAVRSPTFRFAPAKPPVVPGPETLARLPPVASSKWLERFDFRFIEGAPELGPYPDGQPRSPRSVLWIQHEPPRPLDALSLAALSDVFFLRIFQVRGVMVPMGTVTLTTYFHADEAELTAYGAPYLLGVADAHVFCDAFSNQVCELWAPDERLLASGTQLAWFRE